MARCTQVTPFVPCTSLAAQIAFYRDRLGFTVGFQAENYAFLRCDAVAIRLVEVSPHIDLKDPNREGAFYIDVDDLDGLFAELKTGLEGLPPHRVRPPFDQDYGQREFHVADEDCTLVFFGMAIAE